MRTIKATAAMLAVALAFVVPTVLMTGCSCSSEAAERSWQISNDADNFGVERRLTVVNTRTDKVLWQVTGVFSTGHSTGDLDVIVDLGDGRYAKHYFDLNEWTTYFVEDVSNEGLPDHFYEVRTLPGEEAA